MTGHTHCIQQKEKQGFPCIFLLQDPVFSRENEIQNTLPPRSTEVQWVAPTTSVREVAAGKGAVKSHINKWFLIATGITTAAWRKMVHRHFSRITRCGMKLHFHHLPWFGFAWFGLIWFGFLNTCLITRRPFSGYSNKWSLWRSSSFPGYERRRSRGRSLSCTWWEWGTCWSETWSKHSRGFEGRRSSGWDEGRTEPSKRWRCQEA